MDCELLLDDLNDAQREAVTAPDGAVLVLAGAGSGKTRVLTRRIAWVMATDDLPPERVLAVTFTNKAAAEMRSRLERLLGRPAGPLWIGTFHGLTHRLLRIHTEAARLPAGFQILDSDDQARLLRRIVRELGYDEKRWPARQIANIIYRTKDEGHKLGELEHGNAPYERDLAHILAAYEKTCERAGLVDFSELLLRTTRLLLEQPDIAAHYQARFRHLLVDEFQDTNTIQYLWLRALAGKTIQPFVVGDDDQSIYGWRGARIENVQRLQHDFAPVRVVRLEQNYRSSGNILNAANALIAKNSERLGKTLWTAGAPGAPIELYAASDDRDEAAHAVARIERWVHEGGSNEDAVILYRANAQSRVFEETFMARGIPYRVYGGLRFFERAEIKDTLAYLRLVTRREDDAAFERIVNLPARGIGARTLETLRATARQENISLWQAAVRANTVLGTRANHALAGFIELIERLSAGVTSRLADTGATPGALGEAIEYMITASGLDAHYRRPDDEQAESRLENLAELVSAASEFIAEPELSPLTAFLAQAALEAGDTQAGDESNAVKLMTLHAAKGLEFPLVLITGLEEGLFPHQKSIDTPRGLEEERRLFYVGMTRTRAQLVLSYAEQRRLHGQLHYARPSRFLLELPPEAITQAGPRRLSPGVSNPASPAIRLGRRVRHRSFGEGVVLEQQGNGAHLRIKVAFENGGTKWLVAALARLEPIA